MSWTLYRYILRELLKLLIPITLTLVGLLSFVVSIKPMSEGLLGGMSLIKFQFYTMPTMLGLALPFAAALATTLVFLRMAADNEVVACASSGMSYASVLLPVAVLGLALTMGLFLMSNMVLPRFYRLAAQTVEADMMSMLVSQLKSNRPFDRFGDVVLYADDAAQQDPPPMPDSPRQPEKLIKLTGVAMARLDQRGGMRSDLTARQANVLLFRGESGRSWVTIGLDDVMYHDPQRGQLAFARNYDVPLMRVPSPFHDSPQFFSWSQLSRIGREPELYEPVRRLKIKLADAIVTARLRQKLRSALGPGRDQHRLTLHGAREGDRYAFDAAAIRAEDDAIYLEGREQQPAEVTYRSPDRAGWRIEAATVVLHVEPPKGGHRPSVRAELREARIFDPRLETATERPLVNVSAMRWPEPLTEPGFREMGTLTMLDEVAGRPRYDNAEAVRSASGTLVDALLQLEREIKAQLHQRAASAISCLLLILAGAALSMQLRHQMPLVVYFWVFLPAIATLIMINTGENMASGARFPPYVGLSVVWFGNVILAVVAGWAYCRLARN